jgi:hypothetical protein
MTTAEQIGELQRATSPHAMLAFVTLTHPRLPNGALRYVADVLDYVRGGKTYTAVGAGLPLPMADDDETEPRIRVTLPNVNRQIGQTLVAVRSRIVVQVDILSSADFDLTTNPRTEIGTATPVYSLRDFSIVDAAFDQVLAEVTLIMRDYAQEPFGSRATIDLLPGLSR